jgi:hypothetical protein
MFILYRTAEYLYNIQTQRTSCTRGAYIIWKGRVHTLWNSALNSENYDHLNSSSHPIDHSFR